MAVFGCFFTQAQPIDFDQLQKLNIHSVGPGHMSGRITAIDAVTSNAKTIYVGGASGASGNSADRSPDRCLRTSSAGF